MSGLTKREKLEAVLVGAAYAVASMILLALCAVAVVNVINRAG